MRRLALLSVLVVLFIVGTAGAQEFGRRGGIGLFVGPQKLIGGVSDDAMIGPWGGMEIFWGMGDLWMLVGEAGAGWTRPRAANSQIRHTSLAPYRYFRTWLVPLTFSVRRYFSDQGFFRPFFSLGAGAVVWQLRYAKWKDELLTPSGVSVHGTQWNAAGKIGLGATLVLGEHWLLDVGGFYSYMYDQTLDIVGTGFVGRPVNGVPNERVIYKGPGDANNGILEFRLGLKILFGKPRDTDGDGILDRYDSCPGEKEDFDGYQDADGCPDPDNDQDGIPDVKDKCPNEKEDVDGFQDEDGCPDPDNDGDGIPDVKDKCPNLAEDRDGFQDEDGCPDYDNDGDAIPDSVDQCPDQAETVNGYRDEDGCPDRAPEKPKRRLEVGMRLVFPNITFRSGSAELTAQAKAVLDSIYNVLAEYPEIRIEIRGYTDNVGSAAKNLILSQRRARAVKRYLVQKGIDPSRMVAVGLGEDHPIADNRTPEGRAKNRRIEFVVIR